MRSAQRDYIHVCAWLSPAIDMMNANWADDTEFSVTDYAADPLRQFVPVVLLGFSWVHVASLKSGLRDLRQTLQPQSCSLRSITSQV